MVTQSAFAEGPSNNTRPGWGHGDKHHVHTGPPGHSVSIHPGDGDHDGNDQGENEGNNNQGFHKFVMAWLQFFQNHHWIWQQHNNS